MSNVLTSNPMVLDTDITSYQAAQTLTSQSELLGIRVSKMALIAKSTTVAGNVTVTDPASCNSLLLPMSVSAGSTADTVLFSDEFDSELVWEDFKVTGLTATGTELYLWYSR